MLSRLNGCLPLPILTTGELQPRTEYLQSFGEVAPASFAGTETRDFVLEARV